MNADADKMEKRESWGRWKLCDKEEGEGEGGVTSWNINKDNLNIPKSKKDAFSTYMMNIICFSLV